MIPERHAVDRADDFVASVAIRRSLRRATVEVGEHATSPRIEVGVVCGPERIVVSHSLEVRSAHELPHREVTEVAEHGENGRDLLLFRLKRRAKPSAVGAQTREDKPCRWGVTEQPRLDKTDSAARAGPDSPKDLNDGAAQRHPQIQEDD